MKTRIKVLAIFVLFTFLYNNFLWAGGINHKLTHRSNIAEINERYLPLIKLLVHRVRSGRIKEADLPAELKGLWGKINISGITFDEAAEQVVIKLTPDEITEIESYIEEKDYALLHELLRQLLPDKDGEDGFRASFVRSQPEHEEISDLSVYHPSSIINGTSDFRHRLPVLSYQEIGNYPPELLELEQGLTLCAAGWDRTASGDYGTLVAPAGMPAINMMVDSAIERKGMGFDIEMIVIEPPYGCTKNLFENWQRRGILVHSISVDEVKEKLPSLINEKTAIIYGESVTNPNLRILDIEAVLKINRGRAAVLIDDTFATSEMTRSLEIEVSAGGERYSVDMTMLGLTKGMSGTGNIISGAVAAKKDWLDLLAKHRNCLPEHAEIIRAKRGLRYLEIRFASQSRNAERLIGHIGERGLIFDAVYPGDGHMIYYVFKEMFDTINNIDLLCKFRTLINAVSLGQVRNLFERPTGGTHFTVGEGAREKGGISPAGVRGSAGVENPEDVLREIDALFEIITLYCGRIPEEDMDDINKIFMSGYVTQEEGKMGVRYLLPKWPVPDADFSKMISDLSENEKARLGKKYDEDERFRKVVDTLIKATEITSYDPVSIAIHHRLFWCLLSGNHTSVIASPDESTTCHKENDRHMQETFMSVLEGKRKGFPPVGNFSLYSRLGRPAVATFELLMTLLEVGAEKALNYDYIGTSFYSEKMAQKAFLEQQAEIVIMNETMKKFGMNEARIETIRQEDPGHYHRMLTDTRRGIKERGLEIIIVTPPGTALFNESMSLIQHDAVRFRILTPDDTADIEKMMRDEVSDKTVLVYFDSLRIRGCDPVKIRDVVIEKNPDCVFGITDSFNLGYEDPRTARNFDFITHVIYYEDSDYGAVIVAKNDKPLTAVWNNPYWSRKNRATAMSEDIAVMALWYVLPYIRVFDERYEENMHTAIEILKDSADLKRIGKRDLEISFHEEKECAEFLVLAEHLNLISVYSIAKDEYFYIDEWTSIRPHVTKPNTLILRVGIENTLDLEREFKDIILQLHEKKSEKYEINIDDATLKDEKIDISKIKELLSNKEVIYETIEKIFPRAKFMLPHIRIRYIEVRHGGTGSQKQTLHVIIHEGQTGFTFEFALKTAINEAKETGFSVTDAVEIPTLKKLHGKCSVPRFGSYYEEPQSNFYAYTEEWISGPTAEQIEKEGSIKKDIVKKIIASYMSVVKSLNETPENNRYLGVSDSHKNNVMFDDDNLNSAVVVDIGELYYLEPLYFLQEFDMYYGNGSKEYLTAIFDGVIAGFGSEDLNDAVKFLETALDNSVSDTRDDYNYGKDRTRDLVRALKEYISDIYIKQFANFAIQNLRNLTVFLLENTADPDKASEIPNEYKKLETEFYWFEQDMRNRYRYAPTFSNKFILEIWRIFLDSLSHIGINTEDLPDFPPNLESIEKIYDFEFLLSSVYGRDIKYIQLSDGTVIIDFEAGRPASKPQARTTNTHTGRVIADSLELNGNDIYLSLGGGSGVYNVVGCLRGVEKSIYLDISRSNLPLVLRLMKYYQAIKDNSDLRKEIEGKKELNVIDYIINIMAIQGERVIVSEDVTMGDIDKNPNLYFGENNLPEIDRSQSPPFDVIIADAADIPLADNSVTKISILELFRWISEQGGKGNVIRAIKEVLRVIRPGGMILFAPDNKIDKDYYIKLFFQIAKIMGITLRIKGNNQSDNIIFEIVSRSDDLYSAIVKTINREMGVDLSGDELRSIIDSASVVDLERAFRADNGSIDREDLETAERITRIVDSFDMPSKDKLKIVQSLIILLRQYNAKKISGAKEMIKRQTAMHKPLRARISHNTEGTKYVFIDRECLPESQQYILEGDKWNKRKAYLENIFPGYRFDIFPGNLSVDMNNGNTIILTNRTEYEELDARFVSIRHAGEEELFPLGALLFLGVGLLNLNESDLGGSPLKSAVLKLCREIAATDIDIDKFFQGYRLEIILPAIEIFRIEQIIQLHSFALDLLEQAA